MKTVHPPAGNQTGYFNAVIIIKATRICFYWKNRSLRGNLNHSINL